METSKEKKMLPLEILHSDDFIQISRFPAPNGWIYITHYQHHQDMAVSVSMCFVPKSLD